MFSFFYNVKVLCSLNIEKESNTTLYFKVLEYVTTCQQKAIDSY